MKMKYAERKVFVWTMCLGVAVILCGCLLYVMMGSLVGSQIGGYALFYVLGAIAFLLMFAFAMQIVRATREMSGLYSESVDDVLKYVQDGEVELTDIVFRKLNHDQASISLYPPDWTIRIEELRIRVVELDILEGNGNYFVKRIEVTHKPSREVYTVVFKGDKCYDARWDNILMGSVDEEFLRLLWQLANEPSGYWNVLGELIKKRRARFDKSR